MARIIPDKDITHSAIQAYLRQQLVDYAGFLQGAPVFVTFYSKNHFLSTHNESLNSVANVFGDDSPVKYNKVENVPLWSIGAVNLATDIGQFGTEADVQAEALMIPGTIDPDVDDVFTMFYDGADAYFRVNNVELSTMNGKRFCKISFHLTTDAAPEDLARQVAGEYEIVADGEAPNHFRTIGKGKALLLQDILALLDLLQDDWSGRFVRNRYDLPALRLPNGEYFYDYSVATFVAKHKLLSRPRGYRDETFFYPLKVPSAYATLQIPRTVYSFLEGKSTSFEQAYCIVVNSGGAHKDSNIELWPERFLLSWDYTSTLPNAPEVVPAFTGLAEYLVGPDNAVPPDSAAKVLKVFRANAAPEVMFNAMNEVIPVDGASWFYYGPAVLFVAKQTIERLRSENTN